MEKHLRPAAVAEPKIVWEGLVNHSFSHWHLSNRWKLIQRTSKNLLSV